MICGRIIVKEDNQVHSFLIKNLSVADFLMGVYLLIIASQDVRFRGQYIIHEKTWRSSALCDMCGVLSMLSSEVSVLILSTVTLDRYMCIMHPLKIRRRRSIKAAWVLSFFTWAFWITITVLPLSSISYFGHRFYSDNGVCLPLHIHDPFAQGWEFSAFLFIGVNTSAFTFIVYAYVRMLLVIRSSKLSLRSTQGNLDQSLVQRFFLIVLTDFLCWMPIIVIKVLSLSGESK